MKLYYSPFACSMAARIVAAEAGVPLDLVRVKIGGGGQLRDGSDFRGINPKGQVPTLILDDGERLTESAAVLPYLADRSPGAGLMGAAGFERYRVQEWLGFVGAELHKGVFYPIFWRDAHHADTSRAHAKDRLAYLDGHLAGREFAATDAFTAADAYLYWWLFLAPRAGLAVADYPAIQAYADRLSHRAAIAPIVAAEKAERAADEAARAERARADG